MDDQRKPEVSAWKEFGQAVTGSLAASAKGWLLWGGIGALVGALPAAYAGARLAGFEGMAIGAAIGAAVGAVASCILRLWMWSEM